jgi:hypothetical protein
MAYFAKIKNEENGLVMKVSVVDDAEASTEEAGIAHLKSLHGPDTIWVQTVQDGSIRKNYASVGYTYDSTRDAFIPPKPHDSWTLNEETCLWQAPIAKPNVIEVNEKRLAVEIWSEELQTWKAYAADDQTEFTWNTSSNAYEAS